MKERGYKEVRYWVPDITSPEFTRRVRAEASALNEADRQGGMAAFLDAIQADAIDEQ